MTGVWIPNGTATDEGFPDRISMSGAVGFAADETAPFRYDAFSRRALAPER